MDGEQKSGVTQGAAKEAAAPEFRNFIAGAWVPCGTGDTFDDVNPADTTEVVGRFPASAAPDAERAVHAAADAFAAWRRTPISTRARILEQAAARLDAGAAQFGEEMTREMGKPLGLSRAEFKRAAQTLRFYATEGQTLGGETLPNDDPKMMVYTQREPLGPVAVIAPWNFPASIPARKIAPALITGNTVVFKPSSGAPLSGLRLAEALAEAGLPAGVLNFITGAAGVIGHAITASPVIRAISFTGSTEAGRSIHRAADFTTRLQMELGGKNPLIVMDDADIDVAVDLTIKGGMSLSGQACTGTSRVIVLPSVRDAYTQKLLSRVTALRVGNGMEEATELGPIATEAQLRTVLRYVEIGKQEARLLCGGERLRGAAYDHGYFVSPAVFTDVTPSMRIAREEIFGPVIAIFTARDYAEAISFANNSEYGLSASIVTRNPRFMHDFPNDIEAGTVKINRPTTGNLVNAPFGGLKNSSISTIRESGRAGLEFYTQIKTIYRGV